MFLATFTVIYCLTASSILPWWLFILWSFATWFNMYFPFQHWWSYESTHVSSADMLKSIARNGLTHICWLRVKACTHIFRLLPCMGLTLMQVCGREVHCKLFSLNFCRLCGTRSLWKDFRLHTPISCSLLMYRFLLSIIIFSTRPFDNYFMVCFIGLWAAIRFPLCK